LGVVEVFGGEGMPGLTPGLESSLPQPKRLMLIETNNIVFFTPAALKIY